MYNYTAPKSSKSDSPSLLDFLTAIGFCIVLFMTMVVGVDAGF